MTIPKISNVPVAPSRTRPNNFRVEGDTFFAHVDTTLQPELNATVDAINETTEVVDINTVTALIASQSAAAAAATAASVVGASTWVSGQTYAINAAVVSQLNFQTYRKRTASSSSTTDPSNDNTNWRLVTGNGAFVPQAVATTSIDLRLGNYFTKTVAANTTFTIDNCPPDGYSFTLEITHTSGSIAFPTSVKSPNNVAPALTTGKTHLFMFVTTNGGTRWRMTAAANYDN